MIGRTISHYRVEEELGAGGMGVVYRARDTHLQRDVALKVLHQGAIADEESRRRFRREALALSRLNHPAIETIHAFETVEGLDVLVMEYLLGKTLSHLIARGALPADQVLSIGIQAAEALGEAHAQGVVHRDLKPANIMILPNGRVKVLDFGLAFLTRQTQEFGEESLTVSRAMVGTPRYMAPEQIYGMRADERTDVYALGLVLYEAGTGRHPFESTGMAAMAPRSPNNVLISPSQLRPELGARFDGIIARCLDYAPDRRFPTARDLRVALEGVQGVVVRPVRPRIPPARRLVWVLGSLLVAGLVVIAALAVRPGRSRPPTIRSLAVLPLANLSGDPDEDVFAQGMTEELCTSLTQVGGIRVITRTSVLRDRDAAGPLAEVARRLKVDAVVGGSVLRSGDRVRITAQLVLGASGEHLWAERYERPTRAARVGLGVSHLGVSRSLALGVSQSRSLGVSQVPPPGACGRIRRPC